ncbi:hypothetical protein SLEP1_g43417 [Rubroshorea leprosula]|uniref:Uncharacterized protein n=1 Tax=Rubroshorea leprosula TaxID=152421 RepID=A0AAV5LCW7_9ROSI|nr:hypothetical protein SLEP1_g43417 [Rubroshorea leprosula]
MSSEDAMSVVGSEVMPLDYGRMDTESSPSPTSSERTVEEWRDEGVVEEEEEEIPSNVLESGGGVDGCYDPDIEIVSEVRGYVSELGSRSSLRGLVGNCNLPHHVLIRPAGVNERACSAPRDHWMPIYLHYLIVGLRFLIPELLVGLLLDYSIGITQLTPNAMRSRRDAEVEQLSAWKAKKTKQNNYKLNEDEVEEVEKLVREKGDVVDILYLTSPQAMEAAELYGPSSLSEAEMDEFTNAAEGLRISKKPRKKSRTSTAADKGAVEKERLSAGDTAKTRTCDGGGKELIPPHLHEKSLFEAANMTGAKHFLNRTLPEVDRRWARDEAVSWLGATVVRHALESASWINALAQEYVESLRDRANLQRQCEQLQKEKEEWEKEKRGMQRRLDEVLPSVTELQNENDVLSTKLVLEERKRKICEEKLEAQDKYIDNMRKGAAELKKNVNLLVHNGMEEHIGNFLN